MLTIDGGRGALIAGLLQEGHSARFTAFGRSMVPTIWPGDKITVAPTREDDVRHGDVVLFTRSQQLVVHRVVALAPLTTRGDALESTDPPVAAGALLGRVLRTERRRFSGLARLFRYRRGGLGQ